jgi:hypothetical protein
MNDNPAYYKIAAGFNRIFKKRRLYDMTLLSVCLYVPEIVEREETAVAIQCKYIRDMRHDA